MYRDRLRARFEKNRQYYETKSTAALTIDHSNRRVMLGGICLGYLEDLSVVVAAGRRDLVSGLLKQLGVVVKTGIADRGGDERIDETRLERLELFASNNGGRLLCPECFDDWPAPIEAGRNYAAASELREERDAGLLSCALVGAVEGKWSEWEEVMRRVKRPHAELRDDLNLASSLRELAASTQSPRWVDVQSLIKKWVDPSFGLDSAVIASRSLIAALWVQFWLVWGYRGRSLEEFCKAYWGEF